MQTPHLPTKIFGPDFQKVYEPAEDTFILLDALEAELDSLRGNVNICMELGSGSGTVITSLSIALGQDQGPQDHGGGRLMLATDINPEACKTTRKCADYHKQFNHIQIIQTDLAESLVDRLENSIDLLVFNPPYVPTEIGETVEGAGQLQFSWAGGKDGRALIDRFLESYVTRLLSKPDGVAFLVAVSENNIEELCGHLLAKHNIAGNVVIKRRAGRELLHVIKYRWLC